MAENLTLDGQRRGGVQKRKKMMLAVLGGGILLSAIVGGYFYFSDKPSEDDSLKADFVPALGTMALYVNTSRAFVFNVQGESRDRLVEIRVQLLVRNKQDQALVQSNLPLIESLILTSFSTATTEQWRDPRSREMLRTQALEEVRDTLQKLLKTPAVEQILLTSYVMQ
ncbi:flagellar basal body-associated FliL family protein [Plesiomonas sp.]|uniref:flagellar basal body-associated FliL family protein n=1 Tax=Plesiomonas sp. TaxID=2486279 RepID=UPI003F32648A